MNGFVQTNYLSIFLKLIMIFNKTKTMVNFNISINDHLFVQNYSVKFLSVYIDSRLTWKTHIPYVSSNLRKMSYLL